MDVPRRSGQEPGRRRRGGPRREDGRDGLVPRHPPRRLHPCQGPPVRQCADDAPLSRPHAPVQGHDGARRRRGRELQGSALPRGNGDVQQPRRRRPSARRGEVAVRPLREELPTERRQRREALSEGGRACRRHGGDGPRPCAHGAGEDRVLQAQRRVPRLREARRRPPPQKWRECSVFRRRHLRGDAQLRPTGQVLDLALRVPRPSSGGSRVRLDRPRHRPELQAVPSLRHHARRVREEQETPCQRVRCAGARVHGRREPRGEGRAGVRQRPRARAQHRGLPRRDGGPRTGNGSPSVARDDVAPHPRLRPLPDGARGEPQVRARRLCTRVQGDREGRAQPPVVPGVRRRSGQDVRRRRAERRANRAEPQERDGERDRPRTPLRDVRPAGVAHPARRDPERTARWSLRR